MKNTPRLSYALLMLGVIITLLASALTPASNALAQDNKTATVIPVLKSPVGIIVSKTPAYKWTVVPGATSYQFEVYKNGIMVFTKYPTGSICGAVTCEITPTDMLTLGNFKWRVRAKINANWMGWSPFASFIISAPPIGFNEGFPNCMKYWARKSGAEWKVDDKYLYSSGLPDKCSAVNRITSRAYANFIYEAKIIITGEPSGGQYPEAYMAIRMGNNVNPADSCWYSGYLFGYSRDGKFSIWKMNEDGTRTAIKGPTSSSAVYKKLWNRMQVSAKGNQFEFYINGTKVASFTDNSYSIGWIGFEMKNHGTPPTTMYVDWAKLEVLP